MGNRVGRSARHRGSHPRTSSGPLFHPSTRSRHGFFVTGTDTGVGKTLVACALLEAFAARGVSAVGMKPVASGAAARGSGWVSEDAERLAAASGVAAAPAEINLYCFAPPIAPHIAAGQAGVRIDLARIEGAFRALAARAHVVVVEGIGGFCVPLGAAADTAQLAARLALPVVLVVGMRLGCLNHALLTVEAVASRGLTLAGWVANHVEPQMAAATENVRALEERFPAPLLGRIAYMGAPDASSLAAQIDIEPLMRLARVRSNARD